MAVAVDDLAGRLEGYFASTGFAEAGVDALRDAADVSLRTLYRHFPSRDAMVLAALDHRQRRYLGFITEGRPRPGCAAVRHAFDRLATWMDEYAPTGCLSLNALAAYPNNDAVRRRVEDHKAQVRDALAELAGDRRLGDGLLVLHEGATAAWPVLGPAAVAAARESAAELCSSAREARHGINS